jgi:hypothetical protein
MAPADGTSGTSEAGAHEQDTVATTQRPFYLIGHNTNTIEEVRTGLARGLNAFEIDINVDERGRLFISHDRVSADSPFGVALPPCVEPFLVELGQLASSPEGAPMALVIFDCKVESPEFAAELVQATRMHLGERASGLPMIYSVPSVAAATKFFEPIRVGLLPNEALMIDEEDDAQAVAAFFAEREVARAAYGNGITTLVGLGLPSPHLVSQMDDAVALMALGRLRFVYPWVLVAARTMEEFMRTGVSGIMVDLDDAPTLVDALRAPEFTDKLRVATRADDPFAPRDALVLEITTADASRAGTDATVTFEVATADGRKFSRSLDGSLNGRLERGSLTYVTLPDATLPPEQIESITVVHDGSGLGPDWRVASIALRTRSAAPKLVHFDCEVTRGQPVTRRLR